MRQAGRYLPEYKKLRSMKGHFWIMFQFRKSKDRSLQPIERFDFDFINIF